MERNMEWVVTGSRYEHRLHCVTQKNNKKPHSWLWSGWSETPTSLSDYHFNSSFLFCFFVLTVPIVRWRLHTEINNPTQLIRRFMHCNGRTSLCGLIEFKLSPLCCSLIPMHAIVCCPSSCLYLWDSHWFRQFLQVSRCHIYSWR